MLLSRLSPLTVRERSWRFRNWVAPACGHMAVTRQLWPTLPTWSKCHSYNLYKHFIFLHTGLRCSGVTRHLRIGRLSSLSGQTRTGTRSVFLWVKWEYNRINRENIYINVEGESEELWRLVHGCQGDGGGRDHSHCHKRFVCRRGRTLFVNQEMENFSPWLLICLHSGWCPKSFTMNQK